MGKPTGFLEKTRKLPDYIEATERVKNYKSFVKEVPPKFLNEQASRCMDCGVPFCHNGCPLGNIIPEFNDAVYNEEWEEAYTILTSTNNFPEFTGRICPAPCEKACVLGINQPPVTIEFIEKSIAEKAFANGIATPRIPEKRTGKKIAVVGGGPSGMACAEQLNSAGHDVTVFERAEEIGGLLRFGIPDFKLEKSVVQRRVDLMKEAGIIFKTGVNVGIDITAKQLENDYDSVALCMGSTVPRDIPIPGRELNGVHFAMDFLSQNNTRVAGKTELKNHKGESVEAILATNKNVVVIGGGDTGSDCVGTSNRQGAKTVTQIELLSKPPLERSELTPWPMWPMQLRTSSSHEEGCSRQYALFTKEFVGDGNGNLKGIKLAEMGWSDPEPGKKPAWVEQPDTEHEIPCELSLLAIGFLHPQHDGLLDQIGVEYTDRGNVVDNKYQTNNEKFFVAGDVRRGQSLVVWAISEGRECAYYIDTYLMGSSNLEKKDEGLQAVQSSY